MKKILSFLTIITLLTAMLVCTDVPASAITANLMTGEAVKGVAQIDGVISEGEWDDAEILTTDIIRNGTNPNGTMGEIRVMWDDSSLYVLVDVTDIDINDDKAIAGSSVDSVEVSISLAENPGTVYDTSTDFWIGITPYDQICGSHELLGADAEYCSHAVAIVDGGYIVEFSFDIGDIAPSWEDGTFIGFEVSINDTIGNSDARDSCVSWADATDMAYMDPSVLGNILFVEERSEPKATEAPSATDAPSATEGEPSVTVSESESGSNETKVNATSASAAESSAKSDDEGGNTVLWIILAAVAVVVVIVVIVVVSKKKK